MNTSHPSDETRWFDAKGCCSCGWSPTHNKALYTAMLNNHLYGQLEKQHKEVEFVKKARTERPPI